MPADEAPHRAASEDQINDSMGSPQFLNRAKCVLGRAVEDLQDRGLPCLDLQRISHDLPERWGQWSESVAPRFIPFDSSLCAGDTIVSSCATDQECEVPEGYIIQPSATRPESFARPYYLDPVGGFRRCKGLFAAEEYRARESWRFDISFVGHREARHFLRKLVVDELLSAFAPESNGPQAWVRANDLFFFDERVSDRQRRELNEKNRYLEAVLHSRLVLCPRGSGANSIRFFEALAACNVPVYIGGSDVKFPLDWIIDWSTAVFRISEEEVVAGRLRERLEHLLRVPPAEINRMRNNIFGIYHQFLAPERKPVFDLMVWLRVWELLNGRCGACEP